MGGIDAVIDDAAVFLDVDFVTKPVGESAIAMVFCGVKCIYPNVVVFGFTVGEYAGGVVDVVFEGEVKSLYDLAAELEIQMLFLVPKSHHISYFGVGK